MPKRNDPPQPPPDEPPIWEQIEDEPARPVAVGPSTEQAEEEGPTGPASAPRAWEPPAEDADVDTPGAAPAPARADGQVEMERPLIEAAVGVLGLAMAGLVFAPWYQSTLGVTASGWTSGTWAVPVFALGLLVGVTVALRFLGRPVSFPVHHATVIEGAGWLSVGFLFLKLFIAPRIGTAEMTVRGWLQITLLLAAAIVLLGGMVSSQAPLVLRPGWLRGRGGTVGLALLVAAAGVGVAFGFLNDVTNPLAQSQQQLEQGLPECARASGVPVPDGFEPLEGGATNVAPGTDYCYATINASLPLAKAFTRYRAAIRQAEGWTYVPVPRQPGVGRQLQADHGEECFSFSLTQFSKKTTRITVIGGPTYCDLARKVRELQKQQNKGQ